MVKIIFTNAGQSQQWSVDARVGVSLLDLAQSLNLDVEGACEGSMACSTCHMIIEDSFYEKIKTPSDEEEDLLDITYGVTGTSRLGCQVVVATAMEGMIVTLPTDTKNMI
jgi:2Fe-2S ferredoxin